MADSQITSSWAVRTPLPNPEPEDVVLAPARPIVTGVDEMAATFSYAAAIDRHLPYAGDPAHKSRQTTWLDYYAAYEAELSLLPGMTLEQLEIEMGER